VNTFLYPGIDTELQVLFTCLERSYDDFIFFLSQSASRREKKKKNPEHNKPLQTSPFLRAIYVVRLK
jgi:hypothetical protein